MRGFGYKKESGNFTRKNSKIDNLKKKIINQAIQLHLKGNVLEATKIYQQIINPNADSQLLINLSKKVTLALAFFALFVAISVSLLSPNRTIFWFVIFGWSGIAATFCPVIILSLFWKKLSEHGAIASMVTGFISIPLFKFFVPNISFIGRYFEKLDVLLPSVILALLAGYTVSIYKK